MKNIDADDFTLKNLLANKKFTVDYFQREYKWDAENMDQLIQDLTNAFMDDWKDGHQPQDVAGYNTYYMGSVVLCQKGGTFSIIDGQQRITSLTLLLIYLNHQSGKALESEISSLIYSNSFGKRSFNLDVAERSKCLDALYREGQYQVQDTDDESTRNMQERYEQICNNFPAETFKNSMLECFIWWVMEKLVLVRILSSSEENAYTIFETMNNRGKSLTKADMLKGFILSKFKNDTNRSVVNQMWKKDMLDLKALDDDAGNQFFQAWLRSQYAETIRPGKEKSVNMDFENIGSRYHNWFKDNYSKGLLAAAINQDIESFIDKTYRFYLKYFKRIKSAETTFEKELEHVYYHHVWGISPSLSYPLYLAPLKIDDDNDTCLAKIDLVAQYLDGFVSRRAANYKMFSASSIRYTMCSLVKTIRGKNLEELKSILSDNIQAVDNEYNFSALTRFGLTKMNGRFIKFFLARLTSFVEENCGKGDMFVYYMTNPGCRPLEIEHIWSDHFEQHTDEFTQKDEFAVTRNSIGDLLLLPKPSNASYNDMPAEDKIPLYQRENMLAASMSPEFYKNNPAFRHFYENHGLSFKSYTTFKKQDIRDRCLLYVQLANLIWEKEYSSSSSEKE